MTYCESCPIFKTCDEEYKKTIKWCYQRKRKLSEYTSKTEEIHLNLKKEGE